MEEAPGLLGGVWCPAFVGISHWRWICDIWRGKPIATAATTPLSNPLLDNTHTHSLERYQVEHWRVTNSSNGSYSSSSCRPQRNFVFRVFDFDKESQKMPPLRLAVRFDFRRMFIMFLRLVGFDCVANGIVALYCASKFNRHKAYWQGLVGGEQKKKRWFKASKNRRGRKRKRKVNQSRLHRTTLLCLARHQVFLSSWALTRRSQTPGGL